MIRFLLFLSICILFLVSQTALAQTASDYYLPLRVGNYLQFHTSEIPSGSGWGARTTTDSIEGSDVISGRRYFREKDTEVGDGNHAAHVNGVLWLRKDSVGNVALGATGGSSNVDSATVVNGILLPNECLTKGYARSYPYGSLTYQDSVVSMTETVSGSAGTFNKCLEIRTTQFDSTGTAIFREYGYYAYGVGLVKNVRTLPTNQAHTDELVRYLVAGVSDVAVNHNSQTFSLSQNYPNPFNPSTSISFTLQSRSFVSLKVIDALGREVSTLLSEELTAGTYVRSWNAAALPSGVYFYQLQSGQFVDTKSMIFLK